MPRSARLYLLVQAIAAACAVLVAGFLAVPSVDAVNWWALAAVVAAGVVVLRFPLVIGVGIARRALILDTSVYAMAVLLLPPAWAFIGLVAGVLINEMGGRSQLKRAVFFNSAVTLSHGLSVLAFFALAGVQAEPAVVVLAALVGGAISLASYHAALYCYLSLQGRKPDVPRILSFLLPAPGLYVVAMFIGLGIGFLGQRGVLPLMGGLAVFGLCQRAYAQYRRMEVAQRNMDIMFHFTNAVHACQTVEAIDQLTTKTAVDLIGSDEVRISETPPRDSDRSARMDVSGTTRWLVIALEPASLGFSRSGEDQPLLDLIAGVAAKAEENVVLRNELRTQATIDHLTGIMNRSAMDAELRRAIARGNRSGTPFAVVFGDLDGFKPINDRWGHEAGDQVLRTVAQRLRRLVRAADEVARLGGDEFLLLLHGADDNAAVEEFVRKVTAAVSEPIEVKGTLVSVTMSIGWARWPEHGPGVDELLRSADAGMYRHKRGQATPAR